MRLSIVALVLVQLFGLALLAAPPPEVKDPSGEIAVEEEVLPPVAGAPDSADGDALYFKGVSLYFDPLTPFGDELHGSPLYRDDYTTRGYRLPGDQLPIAADPSDFQSNPLYGPPNLGVSSQSRLLHVLTSPTGADFDSASPTLAFGAQVRPGIIYDTGAIANSTTNSPAAFNPGTIALDAHNRGNVFFVQLPSSLQTLPLRLQTVASFGSLMNTVDVAHVYADGIYLPDTQSTANLRGRSLFARLYSGDVGVVIGKAETAFGDLGSAPMLVGTGGLPVGAVGIVDSRSTFTGVSQLRITRHWNDDLAEATVSIEDQSSVAGVAAIPTGAVAHNYPAFVGRIRYHSTNDFDSFQLSGLLRPIGINDSAFANHNGTGWGVSAIARMSNTARTDALYCGVVGGSGVGGYVFGNVPAATFDSNQDVQMLGNFGAYVAYQHVWSQVEHGQLSSNVTYGFLSSETASANDNRQLHQFWCNLLWNPSDTTAFGLEYQYGKRVVGSGDQGEDHRLALVAQFQAQKAQASMSDGTRVDATDTGRRPLYLRRL